MTNKTLGEKLRELRVQHRLSMLDVAEKLGITASAIGNYEKGYREPNLTNLKKLAKIYNVSLNYLVDEPEYNPKDNSYFHNLNMFSGALHPTETASEAFVQIVNISPALKDNELETLRDYFSFLISQRKNTNTKDTP